MEQISFEEALMGLQKSVTDLEDGGLSLEETIQSFEQGRKYADVCYKLLENAQLRITELDKEDEDDE